MSESRDARAHACVRFIGATLDPLAVTVALRLPYDHIHCPGEPRVARRSDGRVRQYAPYPHGMWSMSSHRWVQSSSLDDHLHWLLDQLEPKRDAIRRLLDSGVQVDFFCYSTSPCPQPPALSPKIVRRATALGITIGIDHYPCDDDEQPPP